MNFGFDVDGTISAIPVPLAAIALALRRNGDEVHIITGQPNAPTPACYERRRDQLAALGWEEGDYDHLFIAGPNYVQDKVDYCRDNDIALMFEDSLIYAAAISEVTPTVVVYEKGTFR